MCILTSCGSGVRNYRFIGYLKVTKITEANSDAPTEKQDFKLFSPDLYSSPILKLQV